MAYILYRFAKINLIKTTMKKLILVISLVALFSFDINAQVYQYQTVTVIESIIPGGLGRSRMISANETKDYKVATSTKTGKKDKRNKTDREEIRVKGYDETKLLNFFNIGGIRFQNIATNDALVTSKINTMAEEGWELAFVNSGIESDAGKDDGKGIYITRYIFRKAK
jgi:hypothetical protein